MDSVNIFGIIMISIGFCIYGTYLVLCIYSVCGDCEECCDNIKRCCCKSYLPLDQDLSSINNDIRVPLTGYPEIILPTSVYNLDQEMNSI